jgi:alkylhydroperoxidase family enzyme
MRIAPLEPPYSAETEAQLKKWMPPGAPVEPLAIFRTLARSKLLFDRMRPLGSGLLNKSSLPPDVRERVILRVCARCGAEYEWGVHATTFAPMLSLDARKSLGEPETIIERAVDELHDRSTLSDETFSALGFTDEQYLDFAALVGFYHLISFVVNVARVPLEPWAERF